MRAVCPASYLTTNLNLNGFSLGDSDTDCPEAQGTGGNYSYVPLAGHASILNFAALTVVSPRLGTNGWPFGNVDEFPGAEADPLFNSSYIRDLYLRADPEYASRFVSLFIYAS
jgi:hypothetical protein